MLACQFIEPSADVRKAEMASLAIATASPCGALPPKVLCNLSRAGFRAQFTSTVRQSIAARFRVSCTTKAFQKLCDLHHDADNYNLDATILPPYAEVVPQLHLSQHRGASQTPSRPPGNQKH